MAFNSGPPARDLFPGHNKNGKGDKTRTNFSSPAWQENYAAIDWSGSVTGFSRIKPHKEIKRYAQF